MPEEQFPRPNTDIESLRVLAEGWRKVSLRVRYDKDRELRADDPGPSTTAVQLEWAAGEINALRETLRLHEKSRVVQKCASLSPGQGVPCSLPAGHQGSHYTSERNEGEWSVGLNEARR